MPAELRHDGAVGPPAELAAIRDALRAADPQLASLEFGSWSDEVGDTWYEADVDGFWLERDLRRIADHLAATVRPMIAVLLWILDEDDNEHGVEVCGETVKADRFLTD